MRLAFLFISLVAIQSVSFTQFESFSSKDKVGLNFNGQIILKAKYDKISLKDDSVATAYKKTKIFYTNSKGDIIYKTKTGFGQEFESGIGVVQNKKGAFHLINRSGEMMQGTTVGTRRQPKRVLDIVEYGNAGNGIFNHTGLVPIVYDSVSAYNEWLIVHKTHKDPYTIKVKDDTKFFGRRKVTRYNLTAYFDVYNSNATKLYSDKIVSMDVYGEYFILKKRDSSYSILTQSGKNICRPFSQLQILSSNYISGFQDSSTILINLKAEKIEIEGNYLRYELKDKAVIAYSTDTDSTSLVDIYSRGELVGQKLNLVRSINNQKLVIQDNSGFFISNDFGKKMAGPFTYVGEIKSNHILVCDTVNYMYISAETWKQLNFYYPLIEAKTYSRTGPPKDFIGSFFYMVFGGWLSDGIDKIEIVDNGHDFYEGWAICAINESSSNQPFLKRAYISSDEKLRYNYINPQNEKLNAKKYKDCFPIYNGKAWVKEKIKYFVIDITGKQSGSLEYDNVTLDPTGYFIVEKESLKGIVSPDYKELLPCEYDQLHVKKGAFYNGYGEQEKLVYTP